VIIGLGNNGSDRQCETGAKISETRRQPDENSKLLTGNLLTMPPPDSRKGIGITQLECHRMIASDHRQELAAIGEVKEDPGLSSSRCSRIILPISLYGEGASEIREAGTCGQLVSNSAGTGAPVGSKAPAPRSRMTS
jgi:hypothetical protein